MEKTTELSRRERLDMLLISFVKCFESQYIKCIWVPFALWNSPAFSSFYSRLTTLRYVLLFFLLFRLYPLVLRLLLNLVYNWTKLLKVLQLPSMGIGKISNAIFRPVVCATLKVKKKKRCNSVKLTHCFGLWWSLDFFIISLLHLPYITCGYHNFAPPAHNHVKSQSYFFEYCAKHLYRNISPCRVVIILIMLCNFDTGMLYLHACMFFLACG